MNCELAFKLSEEKFLGNWFTNKSGEKAKVIRYRGCYDIDIEFEDGHIRNVKSQHLINGKFLKEKKLSVEEIIKKYIGIKGVTPKGYKYTITDYCKKGVFSVTFNIDKSTRKYPRAKIDQGRVEYTYDKYNSIGKEFKNKSGHIVKIIKYRRSADVDVIFEDGEIGTFSIRNLEKELFAKPSESRHNVKNFKEKYEGKIIENKYGDKYKIIEYKGANDIDILFLDGNVIKNVCINVIKENSISHPLKSNKDINNMIKKYVGKKYTNNVGMEVVVLKYTSSKDISIQFNDGTIKVVNMGSLESGSFSHPKDERTVEAYRNTILGKTYLSNSGELVKVVKYEGSHSVFVEFEDKSIHKYRLCKLKIGNFTHPDKSNMNKSSVLERNIGVTYMNKSGLKATCIEYNGAKSITLQFEDNETMTTCKRNAVTGMFSHPIYNTIYGKDEFVVYRFLDENYNILYIGRSVQHKVRLFQHFNKHSVEEGKEWYSKIKHYQYIKLHSSSEMCGVENYLIRKYNPIGNNKLDNHIIEIDEGKLIWKEYDLSEATVYLKMIERFDITKNY